MSAIHVMNYTTAIQNAKRSIARLELPPVSFAHLRDYLRTKSHFERDLEKFVHERGTKEGDLTIRLARLIDTNVVHRQVLRIGGARFTVIDPAQA